jgi:hypothetical protein
MWPWEDNSVDEVRIIHGLEHMGATTEAFFHFMKEMYRVCQKDATVTIVVPHPRSDGYLGDPTHVRPITGAVMALFSRAEAKASREAGHPNTPLCEYIGVDFQVMAQEASLFPSWHHRYTTGEITKEQLQEAVDAYNNVISEINITLRVVKDE